MFHINTTLGISHLKEEILLFSEIIVVLQVVYELKNSTIDLQKLLKVTAYVPNKSDYFWKFMTQIFSPQKEELICIEGMGKIESMRVKNK